MYKLIQQISNKKHIFMKVEKKAQVTNQCDSNHMETSKRDGMQHPRNIKAHLKEVSLNQSVFSNITFSMH